MANIDTLASRLQAIMSDKNAKKPKPFDSPATVTRIEGNTLWVHIPGGVEETPVKRTINAVPGDEVRIHVENGGAWTIGNATNPPTDDAQANIATKIAYKADDKASSAIDNANIAQQAAQSAVADADRAKQAADQANGILGDMQVAAEQADTTLTQIFQDAKDARVSAEDAEKQAVSATTSATNALNQLSVIENVVGVLDLLSKHGNYSVITDTDAVAEDGKWYFTRSGSGTTEDPYTYAVVNLNVGDSVTGYYELTSIDQAVTNYVSSHLALTADGLSLQQGGSPYRILINANGLSIIGQGGATVASYGTETVIGNQNGFHVQITGSELGFYQGALRVAYINNNQLYITQSVVLEQMDLGFPFGQTNPVTGEVGKGQWSWKVHANGENPSRNNLNLKWIG